MRTPFSYGLISVGVNQSPGTARLRFAERDALAMAAVFAGQLGPVPPEHALVLRGKEATCSELDAALVAERRRGPDYLTFFFDGHGNADGLGMADDLYSFARLRHRLAQIGATSTIVMLNCCGAGGFAKSSAIGGLAGLPLQEAWDIALLSAAPGVRVFMACAADATTLERGDIGGVYAHALLRAMRAPRAGDLQVGPYEFVSDALVCKRAAAIMLDYDLAPQSAGIFGDFPMVIANRLPAGEAEVAFIQGVEGQRLEVGVVVHDRRWLPTTIVATARDAFGNRWPAKRVTLLPRGSRRRLRATFDVDVTESLGAVSQLRRFGACRIAWDVAVLDEVRRPLAQVQHVVDYHP